MQKHTEQRTRRGILKAVYTSIRVGGIRKIKRVKEREQKEENEINNKIIK